MGFGRSFKRFVHKTTGLGGGGGGSSAAAQAAAAQALQQQNIAAGNGRLVNGQYVAYSAADKAHVQAAEANKNAEYQDISMGSQLGRYYGEDSLLGRNAKRMAEAEERRRTLLGGFTPLGV